MIEKILNLDTSIFRLINSHWTNQLLDAVLPFLRQPYFWIPLYVFILTYMLASYGKRAVPWIITLMFVFAYTDMTAASLLKPWVSRIRPCNDLESVRLLVNCGGGYSFPSAHASNHFGISFYIIFSLNMILGSKTKWLLFLWAFAVAYAQVYVGVHYPLDILMGAFLGIFFGKIGAMIYLKNTSFIYQ